MLSGTTEGIWNMVQLVFIVASLILFSTLFFESTPFWFTFFLKNFFHATTLEAYLQSN